MTRRERVLTALNHAEPDRVPTDYMANPGIDARLKAHFGLRPDDAEGLRQALHVDFRHIMPPYIGPKRHPDLPDRKIDIWGIRSRWVAHETGGYWDYVDFPLQNATLEQAAAWPGPTPDDYDYAAFAALARAQGDACVVLGGPGTCDFINKAGMLFGTEAVLVGLMDEDPALLRFMDRKIAHDAEVAARALEAAAGRVDLLWIGEDLGTQRGPAISLDLFRRILRPRHEKILAVARAFNTPVMIHSCGSSSWAFEDFIAMGIAAVDTLQPEAADMDPADLKRRYGQRLAFHGMISTAGPLANGTPDDVERLVRDTLQIMMPGGGYCLAPTHQIQDNSPTANVLRLYDAAHRLGRYRG